MKFETEYEFRVVCKSFHSAPGHHDHVWAKDTFKLTKWYADKLSDDMAGQKMAALELPYQVQARMVSQWAKVNEGWTGGPESPEDSSE